MNKLPNVVSSASSDYIRISFQSDHPMFDEPEFKDQWEYLINIVTNGTTSRNRSAERIKEDVEIGLKPEYYAYKIFGHDLPEKNQYDYDTILNRENLSSLLIEHKTQRLSSDKRESWYINKNCNGKLLCHHLFDVIKSKEYTKNLRIWKWNYCNTTRKFYLMFVIINTYQLPRNLGTTSTNTTFVQTKLMASKNYLIFNPTINDLYK